VTAVILNAARRMLSETWDGATPLRQVGLGVSKLTHESAVQMSLFEDPKMEYYREWDRQYDEQAARAEDARMLAYEHKAPQETPKAETAHTYVVLREVKKPSRRKDDALVFTYPDREKALAAAKKAVREDHSLSYERKRLEDGTECFEVSKGGKVLERHLINK
jgi:hypothetical protein